MKSFTVGGNSFNICHRTLILTHLETGLNKTPVITKTGYRLRALHSSLLPKEQLS